MTEIKFISGLDTIGGTIIEVRKDNKRLIFDFGTAYDPASKEEIIPNVGGVYENDESINTAILISHLHLDHSKAMNLVDLKIPVYMSSDSNKFVNTLYELNFNGFLGKQRNYIGMDYDITTQICGFDVTFLPVDHDVIGASAILIENKDVRILYTGDYRMSGRNSDCMDDIINNIGLIDLIISEGVTISFIDDKTIIVPSNDILVSEKDFVDNLGEITNKKILFNHYIMGVERLESFCKLAISRKQKLYVSDETYKIIETYLKQYLSITKKIDTYNINEGVIEFNFDKRDEHIELYKNSYLIQSGGEPLGTFDPNYKLLEQYCEINNIFLNLYGIGGHATPENLLWFLSKIKHKYLVPLHSFKRKLVKVDNSQQVIVKEQEIITFKNHEIID